MRAATVRYILRVILWLRRTLAAERADVAHFFLPYSYIYGMAASWLVWPRPKRVMSRLSLNFYQQSHKIAGWVEHVLHGTLDVAVGNSERILDDLRKEGVPVPRLRLLYNGIDPQPFERHEGDRARARAALNIQDASFMMLAVGNLHVYKGHAELLEACALALPALPARWLLCVAGQDVGGNRAVYERRVADLRLGHHVLFMGGRDDIARLLQAADLLVHPSHHEGLPNAIIEAMAASLPVVATRVGGIPELVVPRADRDATGWLVPPRHPEALAKALVEAAGDDDGRVAMGIRARARVAAHFSLERSVSSYEAIYRELVPRTGES